MQDLASNGWLGTGLFFMSLTLLGPASLLQHALLLLMEGVQEGKLSHYTCHIYYHPIVQRESCGQT